MTGILPSPWEAAFQAGDVHALPTMYTLGRLVSVLMGAATTLVVAALAGLLGGRRAALAAGIAYAVAPLAVVEAHYLTNDVTMSALVAGSVLCAVLAARSGSLRLLALASVLLGLAVSAKYSALFALPGLLVAQWAVWRYRPAPSTETSAPKARRALLAFVLPLLAATAGFFIGEPYALLAPGKLTAGLEITAQGNAGDLSQAPRMLAWQAHYLGQLGLTWPLALLALGGLGLMLAEIVHARPRRDDGRGTRDDGGEHSTRLTPIVPRPSSIVGRRPLPSSIATAIVLATVASLSLGLAFNRVFMLRYTQPLVPLLAVAAGLAIAWVPFPTLRWPVAGLAYVVAGVITLGQLSLMSGPHTANQLLSWLQAHLRPGQQVARLWPEYPVLDDTIYKLIRLDPWRPDMPPGARPDYIIMDDMQLGPLAPSVTNLLARDYVQVARFHTAPNVFGFSWEEGITPHDWKYSHPTFVVYAQR